MKEFRKTIERYIESYTTTKGIRYRVSIPDGRGGQIRKQGFEFWDLAFEWTSNKFLKRAQNLGAIETNYFAGSFADYANEWLQNQRKQLSSATFIKYRSDLDRRLIPFFGDERLVDLSKNSAREFLRELQKDESINNSSRAMAFALLKRIVKSAERDDCIPITGIVDLLGPRPETTRAEHWSESEREYFLSAFENHTDYPLWKFALFTGMRAGEIAALKWDCVKFGAESDSGTFGIIEVRRTRCQKTGEIRETTKNGDRRFVPIFKEALEVINQLSRMGPYVFGGSHAIDTKHLSRDLRKAARKCEVKEVTFHQLRHSFCSWLENNGLERRVVAEILGHRDLATTNRYSHTSSQAVSLAVARFEKQRQERESNKIPTTLSLVK